MKTVAFKCALFTLIVLQASAAYAVQVKAPFVGCPADGQAGPIPPPSGKARIVILDHSPPGPLAFYKGGQSFGVFGPAGWYCRVWYGSAESTLVVTPKPINPPYFPQPSFGLPVIKLVDLNGETSGKFDVASFGSMLFPKLTKKFVDSVANERIVSRSQIVMSKDTSDSLAYINKTTVEYRTPPNTGGLGTYGAGIKSSKLPIRGLVKLQTEDDGSPAGILILGMSLTQKYEAWIPALLKSNSQCLIHGNGC